MELLTGEQIALIKGLVIGSISMAIWMELAHWILKKLKVK